MAIRLGSRRKKRTRAFVSTQKGRIGIKQNQIVRADVDSQIGSLLKGSRVGQDRRILKTGKVDDVRRLIRW
jgi:hypothetical protein